MSNIFEKHSLHETTLPTTEASFIGLRHTAIHPSIREKTSQRSNSFQSQHVASQSLPIQQIAQCRICLQSQSQSGESFITPCNCTGTVQYIHSTCFTQWVRTSLVNKQNKQLQQIEQQGLKCDLCKMSLEINIKMEKTLVSLTKLKLRITKSLFYFSIIILILLCAITLLSISATMLPSSLMTFPSELKSEKGDIKETAIQKVTMLCCLIVSIIILSLMVLLLVRDFLIAHKMKVWSNGKNNIKIELKGLLKD